VQEEQVMAKRTFKETIHVKSHELVATVKDLIAEGNVRRIRIRHGRQTIAEFPLTVGVVGALLAPVLAALGGLAAVLAECSIEVERTHARPEPVAAGDRAMDDQC
jgi:hypothetical protein